MSEFPSSRPLTPLEAAHHLGITPELLFGYTKSRFGKSQSNPRPLATIEIDGKTRFNRVELNDFDRYLKEPWTDEGSRRTAPPKCVVDHLRAESANQCARCGSGIGVQTAHIVAWAKSRSHHHHNLIRLCSTCHAEHDEHNSLLSAQLHRIKKKAIARTCAMLEQRMAPIETQFLPPRHETVFMGRSRDLKTLRDALRASRTVLVRGPGGIGKTQLLLRTLACLEIGRRVVWIDVEQFASAEGVHSALHVLLSDEPGLERLDTLVNRLDALHACVVLDGVEQLSGPSLDDIDDLLTELKDRTTNTQLVVTSQVDLQRTQFDTIHLLAGLETEPSRRLLRSLVRDTTPLDVDSESGLLSFVEGHPHALRLAATLVDYLGSGRTALEQIHRRGAATIELQKRTKQDRKTSLIRCLSLAYEMLDCHEQRLLYLIANCPGGILTHQLERDNHGGVDAPLLLAALRRWSLVQTKDIGQPIERSHMLSPIRSYVRLRWREEHASEAQTLSKMLLHNFGVMAAVVDQGSQDPVEIPHMLSRFSQELPNLLHVIDEAEAQPGDTDLSFFASGICSTLMRYFFILRLPEQGAQVMQRGAQIALRDGRMKRASELIVQMVALAHRSDDMSAAATAKSMLDQIATDDAETSGNVALTRAVLASIDCDPHATEEHARAAIRQFKVARNEFETKFADGTEDEDSEHINNDLSSSFGKLGDALLAQNSISEARTSYETSLNLLCGGSIAVNEGQLLHQIGNCENQLGRHAKAADCYAKAAVCFQAVGMQEFISNALGELGYTLIELDDDTTLPNTLPQEVLANGLDDCAEHVTRCFFSSSRLNLEACGVAIRKLFGVVIVLSLSDEVRRLGPVAHMLKEQVIAPLADRVADVNVESGDQFALYHLDALVALALSIAVFEHRVEMNGTARESDVEEMSRVCFYQGPWADLRTRSFDWLSVYLRRKWLLQGTTADSLREAISTD